MAIYENRELFVETKFIHDENTKNDDYEAVQYAEIPANDILYETFAVTKGTDHLKKINLRNFVSKAIITLLVLTTMLFSYFIYLQRKELQTMKEAVCKFLYLYFILNGWGWVWGLGGVGCVCECEYPLSTYVFLL